MQIRFRFDSSLQVSFKKSMKTDIKSEHLVTNFKRRDCLYTWLITEVSHFAVLHRRNPTRAPFQALIQQQDVIFHILNAKNHSKGLSDTSHPRVIKFHLVCEKVTSSGFTAGISDFPTFLVGHVKAMFLLLERWHMERTHSISFHRKVVMEAFFLVCEQFYSVGLNMLLHVVTLDKSPFTVRTLVRFVPAVNLPVSVQTAWVS